jgi:hypothetical protein
MATVNVSDDYRWLALWRGALVVKATADAGGDEYEVPPNGEAKFCDHGLALAWPGDEPSGVFLPWSSVAYIRQTPDGGSKGLHAA